MQIRGTQKRMIAVKTTESSVFEEAYFVLRANIDNSGDDIIAEAERIIQSKTQVADVGSARGRGNKIKNTILCISSFVIGVILATLFIILL